MNINASKNLATVYKELMRARSDPSSLSKGAGLQTTVNATRSAKVLHRALNTMYLVILVSKEP